MADFLPIGLQAQPPKTMTLGEMVGVARGIQEYKQAQQMNPVAYAKAQEELARSQMQTETASAEQNAYFKNMVRNAYGGLLADPSFDLNNPDPAAMAKKIEGTDKWLLETVGIGRHRDNYTKQFLDKIKTGGVDGAKEVIQTIRNGVQQGQTLATQGQQLNQPAQYINTGHMAVPIYQSPYQSGGPGRTPSVKMELTPNQIVQPTGNKDIAGNPTAYVYDTNGNIIGETVIPAVGAGAQQGQQMITPARAPYETAETMGSARNIQLNANMAAKNAINSQFNNNKIIELADSALVGVGAQGIAKIFGGSAIFNKTGIDAASSTADLQKLNHQIALETQNLASAAGLGTDAARGLAGDIAGKTEWTPDAIKSTARLNRALATGISIFNEGVNNAVRAGGNNPLAAREFQNIWSSQENLVPTLQFIDAVRNKDQEAIKKSVDAVGGYGSNGYKQLLMQADNLSKLVKGK